MSRGGFRGGRGSSFRGRGGFSQRDMGPPETVLGEYFPAVPLLGMNHFA